MTWTRLQEQNGGAGRELCRPEPRGPASGRTDALPVTCRKTPGSPLSPPLGCRRGSPPTLAGARFPGRLSPSRLPPGSPQTRLTETAEVPQSSGGWKCGSGVPARLGASSWRRARFLPVSSVGRWGWGAGSLSKGHSSHREGPVPTTCSPPKAAPAQRIGCRSLPWMSLLTSTFCFLLR